MLQLQRLRPQLGQPREPQFSAMEPMSATAPGHAYWGGSSCSTAAPQSLSPRPGALSAAERGAPPREPTTGSVHSRPARGRGGALSAAERGAALHERPASSTDNVHSRPVLADSRSDDSAEETTSSSEVGTSSGDECGAVAQDVRSMAQGVRSRRSGCFESMAYHGLRAAKRAKSDGGPKPQRLPDGTWVTARWWGIKRKQLEDFYNECRQDEKFCDRDTVTEFVPKFVKPITDGSGLGLALFLNQDAPMHVNVMISHAWQENAKIFFEDLLEHMKDFEVAFICFLSNYQGTRDEIDEQLGNDMSRSPFTEVLSSMRCHRLLVVPNEELCENGEGLYSRLWCDWEIKVAADMGLPIHVTQRRDECYLLGSKSQSSKNARCGNEEDMRLIREVIETKPVEHGKFQSMGVFVFSICVAYGPRVAVKLCGKHAWVWLAGYPGGIAVGFGVLFCILRPIRSCIYRLREHDGYQKLDSIIKAAARQEYVHRRFRPMIDLPLMATISASGGLGSFLYIWQVNRDHAICYDKYFYAILAGLFGGLLLWPVLHVNSIGPWTGVFFLRPKYRMLAGAYLLSMIATFAVFFNWALEKHGDGQGALWGVLTGMTTLSLVHRRWKHAFINLVVLCYMVGCYFLMKYMDSWLLWRDTILVALGASGYQMVPGLSRRQQVAAWVVCPAFVVGLAFLSYYGQDIDMGCHHK